MPRATIVRNNDARVALLMFLGGVVSLSPVFLYTGPMRGSVFSLLCILLTFVFYKKFRITHGAFLTAMVTVLLALLTTSYWTELKLLMLPIYFVSGVVLAAGVTEGECHTFVELSSKVLLLILIGCWIGFVYVLLGGDALISFPNEDGRMNGWYLTTLSNSKVLRIIRPAGIFDEPGTLSFVVCMMAALRHTLRMDKRTTWLLLGLTLVTMSIAHIIYTALHLIAEMKRSTGKTLKYVVIIGGVMVMAILLTPALLELLTNSLFQRFVLTDGQLAGDNRSRLLASALNYLDGRVFLWGLDVDCIVNPMACAAKGYLQFGENPVGPLVLYGIFIAWPYYMLQSILIVVGVVRLNFIALGIFALLLQRPNLMAFGYALLIALAVHPMLPTFRVKRTTTPVLQPTAEGTH